ncbi:MAG: DUF86 domain-containing protein [Actinomycetota bacterium]|nr:DUF86 domain-containing protein [Actinomycetota bacterium]MDQ3352975.1 DUF86 domain-containing protein [Actinomycetota bacterium]
MSPAELDREVLARRLRLLQETLDELRPLASLEPVALGQDPVTRAAIERFVQVLVDLAADVNTHLAVAQLGQAPVTTGDSFIQAAALGAIPLELAQEMAPAAGLRNLLVHRYGDINLDLLTQALPEILEHFSAYVTHVAHWLANLP